MLLFLHSVDSVYFVVFFTNFLHLKSQIQDEVAESGPMIESKLWRNFDVNQMLSLLYYHGIIDFFFAEIMLDWISFKTSLLKKCFETNFG